MHEANISVQETDDEVPSCNLIGLFPLFPSVWRSGLFCGCLCALVEMQKKHRGKTRSDVAA